jgi:hypothetical protein
MKLAICQLGACLSSLGACDLQGVATAGQLDIDRVLAVLGSGLDCHVANHLLEVPALQLLADRLLAGGAGFLAADGLADVVAVQQPGTCLPTLDCLVVRIVSMTPAVCRSNRDLWP